MASLNFTTVATNVSSIPSTNALPTDLSSLLNMLLSFSALRDWLKLALLGGLFETCRRTLSHLWDTIVNSFWLKVELEEGNQSYTWIMFWLSQQPSWATAREMAITTHSFGGSFGSTLVPGEETAESPNEKKLGYTPCLDSTYTFWYKRHYMRVTRTKREAHSYHSYQTVTLWILARNHTVLNELLLEAKMTWRSKQENQISIFASDSSSDWRLIATRPKRSFKSIILDEGIKELLLGDALDFLESKSWYTERGIPFRRGYLLYGAPGSGKTSLIHSIAGELELDIYVISLSRNGLDDNGLQQLISELPEKCIALMEDIDAALHRGITREAPVEKEKDGEERKPGPSTSSENGARISLSGLLNALDGVGAQEGRILFATTNRYEALDPALCRPGRMDLHVEFKLASKYQARELFKCFYIPSGYDEDVKDTDEQSVDSGYGTPSVTSSQPDEKLIDVDTPPPSPTEALGVKVVGISHKIKAPKLTSLQVNALAEQFGHAIPEREISMATLQGYLMTYKVRPLEAAGNAEKWVMEQKKAKAESKDSKDVKQEHVLS